MTVLYCVVVDSECEDVDTEDDEVQPRRVGSKAKAGKRDPKKALPVSRSTPATRARKAKKLNHDYPNTRVEIHAYEYVPDPDSSDEADAVSLGNFSFKTHFH